MSNDTLFIIGAGASKEVDLPIGEELKKIICNLIDFRYDTFGMLTHGDEKIVNAIKLNIKKENKSDKTGDEIFNEYLLEAEHIKSNLIASYSIDNFIDTHRDNKKIALLGKLGIVKSILQKEKGSKLYFENDQFDYNKINNTWYLKFFKSITENCNKDDLKERFKLIKFIIFNYDRCVEHFLNNALKQYYRLTESEIAEIVNCLTIYHPYGSIGQLPLNSTNYSIKFGADPTPENLLTLSGKIKTFTEGTDPNSSEIQKIKEIMSNTNRIVFLGFAFHKLNMQLIKPNSRPEYYPKYYASVYNISDSDQKLIKNDLDMMYRSSAFDVPNSEVFFLNSNCNEFYDAFKKGLSF